MRNDIKWIDGKTVSIDKIKEVENKILFPFPKSYIQIIKDYNGAYPKPGFFLSENGGSAIDHFFEIEEIINCKENYNNAFKMDIPKDHEDLKRYTSLIPFAYTPGGSHLCFDYYQREVPAIIFLTDVYDIDFVANSFDEFIDSLYLEEDIE